MYRLGEEVDEPDSTMVPEPARVADSVPRSDKLSQSLRLLADALNTGKVVDQFEMLYRKKPGLSMNICRLNVNLNKNRYRDVCPYDETRVILQSGASGDYINANYVNVSVLHRFCKWTFNFLCFRWRSPLPESSTATSPARAPLPTLLPTSGSWSGSSSAPQSSCSQRPQNAEESSAISTGPDCSRHRSTVG